jgi:ComF family protein
MQMQHNNIEICADCLAQLPWLGEACKKCALPLLALNRVCGSCSLQSWPFVQTISPFIYTSWIKQLISRYKYTAKLNYGVCLSRILAAHIGMHYIDIRLPQMIIPVPLFSKKLRMRGFNQSYLIADVLSKSLGIKIFTGCKKITASFPQANLNKSARQQNIKNSFVLERNFSARSVAIVDDVITTGTTAIEIAKILANAGVCEIYLWSIARAV